MASFEPDYSEGQAVTAASKLWQLESNKDLLQIGASTSFAYT